MSDEIDALARELGRSRSDLLRAAFRSFAASCGAQPNAALSAAEAGAPYVSSPKAAFDQSALPGLARVLAHRDEIRAVCDRLGVRRLWLYGSAVRDDFDPASSDLDFQVEWTAGAVRRPFRTFLELKDALAGLLGAPADVTEADAVRNPYLRDAIEKERLLIHDAT
jgi:predicted nucleotidyltransferase